jgi:alcohol dehydrogenase class IV
MQQFNYPTTILYGSGATEELGRRLKRDHRRVLLVTDPGVVKAGVAAAVVRSLESVGVSADVYSEIHGNPIEADVNGGAQRYRSDKFDGIVAVGGGSPIDAAKVIAVLASHDQPLATFEEGRGGTERIDGERLPPVYAVATTAGTGSEVGRSGVIVSGDTGRKLIVFHPRLLPRIAVLDPELTIGLPAKVTAATGMDAFTHGIEAYFARAFHPMADAIALGGMELVIANLPTAVARGGDREARGRMLLAAAMGATAFQKGLGCVHSLAHPLSTHYNIHHGLANALMLAPALAWQLEHKRSAMSADLSGRYARVARLFPGHEAAGAAELPRAIADFVRSVGITETLASSGVRADDLDSLADEAWDDPCHRENPIPLARADLRAIYASLLSAS